MKDIVLLAVPKTPAWDFAQKIHDYIKENKEKEIEVKKVEMTVFRDGEYRPHTLQNIRSQDVYFIQSSNKHPGDWFTELVLMRDSCLSSAVNSLNFVLPYMRFSRQDRKDTSRVPISTRAIAEPISKGVKRIITMDLHSPQIQNAYPAEVAFDNLQSFPQLIKYLKENYSSYLENLVIASPDVGGGGRANSLYKKLLKSENPSILQKNNYSFIIMNKIRDKPGSVEDMSFVGDDVSIKNIEGKNVLVIDDILDSGGSGIKAAELLRKKGAQKLMFYATHGLFTKGTENILKAYDVVMTSNTHYNPKKSKDEGIKVIDMSPTFAEAIYRAQEGLSISKLFE